MAGGSTLSVLDYIRDTEQMAADYTATSQAVLDAIREVNADKTENAAKQVEIRRWAVEEAKQVLDDAQKAMDDLTTEIDSKIEEYKKTKKEAEAALVEAEAAVVTTSAAVTAFDNDEYVKRYKESQSTTGINPLAYWTSGNFRAWEADMERQNGARDQYGRLFSDYMDPAEANESVGIMGRLFGYSQTGRQTAAANTIEEYTKAVEKAAAATANVTAQQTKLREATFMLAQAELDKTLREEM